MELVPVPDLEPDYDPNAALTELVEAVNAGDALLESEKATRGALREALAAITQQVISLDLHMVGGHPLPDVWQLLREKVEPTGDSVLKVGIAAATQHLRNNPGDTAGAARILDACQITADLMEPRTA